MVKRLLAGALCAALTLGSAPELGAQTVRAARPGVPFIPAALAVPALNLGLPGLALNLDAAAPDLTLDPRVDLDLDLALAPDAAEAKTLDARAARILTPRFQKLAPEKKAEKLEALFHGFRAPEAAVAYEAAAPALRANRSAPDPSVVPARGPPAPDAAPRTGLGRAVRTGIWFAALNMALNAGIAVAASLAGWTPHGNYGGTGDARGFLETLYLASVQAPVTEEILFRGFLMTGAALAMSKVLPRMTAWIVSGVATSALFVVAHETADPVLMGIRMAGALMMAYIYARDGMAASMANHAAFNGMITLGMLSPFLVPLTVSYALLRGPATDKEKHRRETLALKAGTLRHYRMTPRLAVFLAAIITPGVLLSSSWPFGIVELMWLSAPITLLVYSLYEGRRRKNVEAAGGIARLPRSLVPAPAFA